MFGVVFGVGRRNLCVWCVFVFVCMCVFGCVKRRGLHGVEEPVIYGGKPRMVKDLVTGKMVPLTVRRFSDNLLMFEVKRRDPAYRDNYPAIDIHSSGPSSVKIVLEGSADDPDGESEPQTIDVTPESTEKEDGGLPDLSVEE